MRDLFIEVIESIRRNKIRTALTGFAVSWGIFMLIVLLGLGNGLRNSTKANMGDISANTMEIRGGWTSKPYDGLEEGRRIRLTENDVLLTTSELFSENIDEVAPYLYKSGVTINMGKRFFSSSLCGVYPAYLEMEKVKILHGRALNDNDIKENKKVIVISSRDAENLLDGGKDYASLIGKRIKAGDVNFLVVGIWKVDSSFMGSEAYIPFTTLKYVYNKGNYIDNILFSFHGLKTEQDNEEFENKYRAVINTSHRAAPDDVSATRIWNRFTTNMMMESGMGLLNVGLWIIGIFTLLSGIVGVSNIMLITVKERTHEFGVRKAIGAKPWALIKLILAESVTITAFFGYIGMAIGMLTCEIVNSVMSKSKLEVMGESFTGLVDPTVGLDVALEATLLLIIAGTLAGLIPARKAAQVRPIEALRAD